jgi:DNA-binding HxlR family transcriptional regulator
MESAGVARWTIDEASNAVKGSFFAKLHEGIARENMRYAEIRDAISEKRRISDRTLSRALNSLMVRNELRKRGDGSYEPVFKYELKDRMEVIAAADRLSIEAGASVGIIGDQDKGWTVYGIPRGKPRELRPKLRRAIADFQDEIDDILRSQAEGIVGKILKQARARGLSSRDAASIRKSLMGVFDYWETLRFQHLGSFAWAQILEKLAPGVLPQVVEQLMRPPIGIADDLKEGMPPHKSMAKRSQEWIPYISRIYQEDEKAVREAWPRLVAEAEEGARGTEALRIHMTAGAWVEFAKRWSSILAARYWLCAVVR